jgi:hypothetical protein
MATEGDDGCRYCPGDDQDHGSDGRHTTPWYRGPPGGPAIHVIRPPPEITGTTLRVRLEHL